MEWKRDYKTGNFIGIPKPRSDAELEILSELYFGVPLHLSSLGAYGSKASYKVAELYDSYHGKGFEQNTDGEHRTGGYDHSKYFWEYVCGKLYCGGVAGCSYGQTHLKSYRDMRRLQEWVDSRRRNDSGRIRKPFARLALRLREEREQANSR